MKQTFNNESRFYALWISNAAQGVLKKFQKVDMTIRNGGRAWVQWLLLATAPVLARTRKSDVMVIVNFSKLCSQRARKSGMKDLVLYLKASQVLLQQSIGDYRVADTRLLKARVSRNRTGLPRIIPREHRALIARKSRWTIRFWMTLLGVYRVLSFKGVLSFSTIIEPGKMISGDTVMAIRYFLMEVFYQHLLNFRPKSPLLRQAVTRNRKGKVDLTTPYMKDLKPSMFEILKSGPSTAQSMPGDEYRDISSSTYALVSAAKALIISNIWKDFGDWLYATGDQNLLQVILRYSKYQSEVEIRPAETLGKLGVKEEAAGKVRVFAMVDAFTQWLMEPLHNALFDVLRSIPQDGTFNQMRPVKALLKTKPSGLWSYDLSAATDRLPLLVQKMILQPVLGLHAAEWWGNILTKREYRYRSQRFKYAVGQPMGALSSWAMLALTHHFLVQWAWWRVICKREDSLAGIDSYKWPISAWRTRNFRWFKLYAVLGDDIILGDADVAYEYVMIMGELGVEIGLAKSLISPHGPVGEFAKRFFIPRDASMVPIKEAVAARFNVTELVSFARKYKLTPSKILTFAGYGYRVKGSMNKRFRELGTRAANLLMILSHPTSPIGVANLKLFFQTEGWRRLRKAPNQSTLQSIRDSELHRLNLRVAGLAPLQKTAWDMMMVKRDEKGGRYNPWSKYLPLYEMLERLVGGVTYEISQISKELRLISQEGLDYTAFDKLNTLEKRIDNLPKPGDLESKSVGSEMNPPEKLSQIVKLWRRVDIRMRATTVTARKGLKGNSTIPTSK